MSNKFENIFLTEGYYSRLEEARRIEKLKLQLYQQKLRDDYRKKTGRSYKQVDLSTGQVFDVPINRMEE